MFRTGVHRQIGRLARRAVPSHPPQRILLLKPDHFGDVLLAGPAVHLLRERFPQAVLTMAVGPRGAEAARRLLGLDGVLVVPFPGLDPAVQPPPLARWLLLLRVARRWRDRFDAAVLLREDFYWGALLLVAAGIPVRVGTANALCTPLLTTVANGDRRPAAAQHLRVAALLAGVEPGPERWTAARPLRFRVQRVADVEQRRTGAGLRPGERYLLLHPGAGAPVKLWTAEQWGAVLRTMYEGLALRTVVVAGSGEADLIAPILRHAGGAAVGFLGAPSLDLLATLMQDAQLVLGVDSGPLHLAAALDVPSVRLYGPTDPVVYGPWGDPARHRLVASAMLCAPCHRLHWDHLALPWHPCVRRLHPDDVARAAYAALGDAR